MVDPRIFDKIATVERCVGRAREEYFKDPATFDKDFTRQDAAVLNIQRACEACIDLGAMIIREQRLGLPKGNAEVFDMLGASGWCDPPLALDLKRMVGYRNIVVHAYTTLDLAITIAVIERHLDTLLAFTKGLLERIRTTPAS